MHVTRKKGEQLSYEEAVERLEQVVRELEQGNLPLEQSLALFQEGIELTRLCTKLLDEAERKIETLAAGEDGRQRLAPLELEEGA